MQIVQNIPDTVWIFAAGFAAGTIVCILVQRAVFSFYRKQIKHLSREALTDNSNQFLELAEKYFTTYVKDARKDLDIKGDEIIRSVSPVHKALEDYEARLRQMELEREKSFGSLTAQLLEMASTQNSLRKETANLVKALRLPHVRGRWGELTLKRVAELSGMVDHCDFTEQPVQGSGQGAQRPDMVVHLPGGRQIIVDAKVSLNAYLDALEASGEPERKRYLLHHARQVNSHVMGLSSKQYWNQFKPTPEFVVMFIPGENYFSAALAVKPDLIESAVAKGVVIATPTTLISLLKAVAYGWRQVKSVENAEKISALGTELYQRLKAMAESLNRLGKDIEKCTMTYNRMAGSMEKRVMVSARKLSQFGASPGGSEAIEEVEPVEGRPKTVEYHENEF